MKDWSPAASLGFTVVHVGFRLTVQLPDLHLNSFTSLSHCNGIALFHFFLIQTLISGEMTKLPCSGPL